MPETRNWKLRYFKIGLLFIVCLALGIALTACTESSPSNDSADNDSADRDFSSNGSADNGFSPPRPLIEYTLKTGEAAKFISIWKTDSTIDLPLVENGNYDFTVDWGDGKTDAITRWNAAEKTHTYTQTHTCEVTISGTIVEWAFSDESKKDDANVEDNALKLIKVSQWGNLHLGDTAGYQFYGAENLNIIASDAPFLHDGDETYTTDLSYAFAEATRLSGNLNNWEISHVENMQGMFTNTTAFNQPIGD